MVKYSDNRFLRQINQGNRMRLFMSVLCLTIISVFCGSVSAQPQVIETVGVVLDSVTGKRLPYVNIYSKEAGKGTVSEDDGTFRIEVPAGTRLTASSLGYNDSHHNAISGDSIYFRLSSLAVDLPDVTIRKKRNKYSKKNNPAVILMERVRSDRKRLDPMREKDYSYDKYDKLLLALNDFNIDMTDGGNSIKRRMDFMVDYVDTAAWTGKRILDLSVKEKYSVRIKSDDPKADKEIITGIRSNGIDEAFEQENIRIMLEDVLREIDIYKNDVNLMQNRFVSPLAAIGPDYYMYEIADTVPVDGIMCTELVFAPKTPESFGFNGRMFIPVADSLKYVKRISMRVPKAINLNYIDNIFVSQNFRKDSLGNVNKTLDDMCLELQVVKGTPKVYAERTTRYDKFSYHHRSDYEEYLNKLGSVFQIDESERRGSDFWNEQRMVPLSRAEAQMGSMMSRIRKVPFLYWSEKALVILVKGYVTTGSKSKFDIGPVNTFVSHNDAEGWRLRLGGITTANLSPHLFARGYVAYGCSDRKFKYSGEIEYSFVRKKYHSREFPMNGIRATYSYDRDRLGSKYLFTNDDNIFLSLTRMKFDLITYRRLIKLEYNLELKNSLSFNIGYKNERQEATPWVQFIDGYGRHHRNYTQGCFFASIRFAPGEKFVQSYSQRLPVNLDAPIITLTHEYGPRRMFGSDYTVNKTELSVMKRFWFSAFGYANVIVKGGAVWSKMPFPALPWQNANISYTIQPEAYALLNPMEFAMDRYASWDLEYFANGALFNRIPGFNRLKLREIIGFKGFVGKLTKKNNPVYDDNLFRFPREAGTVPMGKDPYMEISAGIDNIFTILRVDYVWRLTYRNRPGIDRSGLRISLHFSF